jgi:glucose-1-phosphate adenylyltransferase
MISHGCVVHGTVLHSLLSPGVTIEAGAVVRDSIVMFDTVVRQGAVLDRAIVDKDCEIGEGAIVGAGTDLRPNRREPERLYAGVTLVGKRARVPAGLTIGRNCRIDPGVVPDDFGTAKAIRSGETVTRGPDAAARANEAAVSAG